MWLEVERLIFPFSSTQVQLFYELTEIMNKVWNKIQRRGNPSPSSAYPETVAGPVPGSPVRSSVGTAPPDTSTCSPSADVGTTTEVSVSERFCSQWRVIYTTEFYIRAENEDDLTSVEAGRFRRLVGSCGVAVAIY